MKIIKGILAIVLGLVAGGFVNMGLVMIGSQVIPSPVGVNVHDVESIRASIHLFEAKHFIFPFLAHALGTLVGATIAYAIAAGCRPAFAFVIGAVNLVGGIAAAFMIPAPAWFICFDLAAAYLPMAWLGVVIGRRVTKTPGQPSA